MRINLNIIKVLLLVFLSMETADAKTYYWKGLCPSCGGCDGIKSDITDAADAIDDRHTELEETIRDYYKKNILKPNLKKIDTIQEGITQSVARINAMEYQANIDSKRLIWSLRQIKDLYVLPKGTAQ